MTGPIAFADLTVGMQVTATTTWTATNASSATSATVVAVDANGVTLSNGDTIPAPVWVNPDTTVGFNLDATAPTPPPPPPALGTIYLDEAGAAWQATGTHENVVLLGIDGTPLDWPGFLDAHPAAVLMQDTPVVPLPDPVSPYPQTIAPGDVKIGMDVRVTITYAGGDTKVVRGICVWVQDNDNTDGITQDFLVMSLSTGDVFPYNPVPADETMTVEQMQAWTAATDWGFTNTPEPAIGTIVRDRNGIAWQRIEDATEDGPVSPWGAPSVFAGQGQWITTTGTFQFRGVSTAADAQAQFVSYDQPINWFWLWGCAAPFVQQEPTP